MADNQAYSSPRISLLPREASRRVHVIINPAAGQDQPVLKALNTALQNAGVEWDAFITKGPGDAQIYAQKAVAVGVDLVIVHGGDGTVREVASGLVGSQVPLAVIPGGTANVMALEMGIPTGINTACALALNPGAKIRTIDMGQINDRYFLLRAGVGFVAAVVEGTDRELKDRLGVFAYALSALQKLTNVPLTHYNLELDHREMEAEGLACIVANAGAMGTPGISLSLAPGIDISDGLLDVIVITRSDIAGILSLIANFVAGSENPNNLQHWQVREVEISVDPPQPVQADGEMLAETPVTIQTLPKSMRIVVPAVKEA